MKFDPTKKFGTIFGISSNYPGAKYEQNGFMFNSQHKCLNPTEAKENSEVDLVAKATEDLKKKKAAELTELTAKVVAAQQALEADSTAVNKTKLTKLTKKYNILVAEIEAIGG